MSAAREFLVGVVVGGAIGAAAALMYAPQPGEATRTRLRESATEARERTAALAEQTRGRASEVVHTAQSRLSEVGDQVRSKADGLSQQAHQIAGRSRDLVERQREAVSAAVDAGRQAYTARQTELQSGVADDSLPAPA